MRLSLLILLPVATVLMFGCGSPSPEEAIRNGEPHRVIKSDDMQVEGTWGHLSGGRSSWFAQEAPGRAIHVCGDHGAELIAGVVAWSQAAGRDRGLSVVASCDNKSGRLITVHGRDRAVAAKICSKFPRAVALTYVDQGTIVVCDQTAKLAEVMLHEAGHLWGMCDVYPDEVLAGGNCDNRFFTGRSRASVMGANYSRLLTTADVAGIAAMTRREDVVGNEVWRGLEVQKSPGMSLAFSGSTWADTRIDPEQLVEKTPSCVLGL